MLVIAAAVAVLVLSQFSNHYLEGIMRDLHLKRKLRYRKELLSME